MALVGLRTFKVGPGMRWNTLEHTEISCSKLSCNVGHFGFELVSHISGLSLQFPAISPLCLKNRQMGRDGAIGGCQILLLIATKLPHPLDMGKLVYFKIESRLIVLHFMSKVTCSVCNEGWISLRHGMDGYSGEEPLLHSSPQAGYNLRNIHTNYYLY